MHAATLLDVFSRLGDPRSARGVRHPFAGMVVLMLLGMLARIREMEVLVRWATIHWDRLRGPLGFDREKPPCATTIIRETLDVPGCRLAIRVDREVRAPDGENLSHDVRYFVSSLDPDSVTAADLLRHVRGHWRIEIGLHFLKDRWWDEDRHSTRRPRLSACLAAINTAALSIHRLCSDPQLPVRAAADYIAWNPTIGLRILKSGSSD